MKINLTEIEIKDLDENIIPVPDMAKKIGNIIFTSADSIEVDAISKALHKGETVEVSEQEIEQIIYILNNCQRCYKIFAHLQIVQYFKNKLETINQ